MPPVEEYTLAQTALQAARYAEGSRFAPGHWYRAEDAYNKGKRAYEDRNYSNARKLFNISIQYAERAENAARLARMQSAGEFYP